jgi:methylthioribose-1-phosphate isomerase
LFAHFKNQPAKQFLTMQYDSIRAIQWQDDRLLLLDQRKLPWEVTYLECRTAKQVADAIRDMVVRGAPAIGITAAYGVILAARQHYTNSPANWQETIRPDLDVLAASRPTAVNLFWALARMQQVMASDPADPLVTLLKEAKTIHDEDIAANRHMGELGAALIEAKAGVLTHCNTGSLATGGFGTALGVIRQAWSEQRLNAVYADETRPWLQGARLTAWELVQDGIPVDLIVEGAAAALMQSGKVQWVIVGSDRIAANGDVANKIGTYSLAVNARHHGVKFMVVAPSTTVDMDTAEGTAIPIETRNATEVLSLAGQPVAAKGAGAWNPVFDVTPAELIDAIVTERGVVLQPTSKKMQAMMASN